jgi:O-Antigen ligase
MQIQLSSQYWRNHSWRNASNLVPLVVIAAAALIGAIVGQEQWALFIALCALIAVLWWPVQLGLGIYALLVPFDMILSIGGKEGRSVATLVGALAAFALLTRAVFTRRLESPQRATYWLGGLFAWSALTGFWALQPKATLAHLPGTFGLVALYIAASCLRISDEELAWVNRLVVIGGCAAAIYACYSYSHNIFYGSFYRRASIMLSDNSGADPNYFAASLLLPLSIAFGGFLASRKGKGIGKLVMLAIVIVIGLTIFLTMSRGALVAMIVMIVVFFYRMRINWRAVVPVACLAGLIAFLPSRFFTRLQGAVATRGAGRLDIWIVSLEALKHYGIFGAGFSNFQFAFTPFAGYAPFYRGPM